MVYLSRQLFRRSLICLLDSLEDLYEEVKLLLYPLQQLQRLIITRVMPLKRNTVLTLGEGHEIVTTFNDICPNLELVYLPGRCPHLAVTIVF